MPQQELQVAWHCTWVGEGGTGSETSWGTGILNRVLGEATKAQARMALGKVLKARCPTPDLSGTVQEERACWVPWSGRRRGKVAALSSLGGWRIVFGKRGSAPGRMAHQMKEEKAEGFGSPR